MTDQERIIELQKQIENTTDFLEQMELLEQKEQIEIKVGTLKPKPVDSKFDCFGCGS